MFINKILICLLFVLASSYCFHMPTNIINELVNKLNTITGNVLEKQFLNFMIDKWYSYNKQELNVMAFGKTGVGKSSLMNSLFKCSECFTTGKLIATTKEISHKSYTINNVKVNFYDTPGLYDDEGNDKYYYSIIYKKIPKMDIILLCYDVRDTRFRRDDFELVEFLLKGLGRAILNKIIVVYTFVNLVDEKTYIDKYDILRDKIKQRTNINPVIMPAGYSNNNILHGKTNWFKDIWTKIFTMTDYKNQATLLKLNFDSLYDEIKRDKKAGKQIIDKIRENPNVPDTIKQKITDKIRRDGCIDANTKLVLCDGRTTNALDVKIGDCLMNSHVYYVYHHYGLYAMVKYKNITLTSNHLINIRGKYVKAMDVADEKNIISNHVVYVLTYSNVYEVNSVILSNHNNNHYWGIIKTLPIRLYQYVVYLADAIMITIY